MRIERLEIKGLTCLTHVLLDLTTIESGVIAIAGGNGAGKTTILEAIVGALYRELPTRGALIDSATGHDSMIDARVTLDGVGELHARVNIDADRRVSEAVLEHQGTPLTDGKVSTYDKRIREFFPSLEVMLASAVAVQNKRGNFITLPPKERKALFGDLLGLNHLEAMSQTAKAALTLVDTHRDRALATQKELERSVGPNFETEHAEKTAAVRAGLAEAQAARELYATRMDELEGHLQTLQASVAAHAAATERVNRLRQELAARQAEQETVERDGEVLEATYRSDLRNLQDRNQRAVERAMQQSKEALADITKRLASNQKLKAQADAVRQAVASVTAIDGRSRDLRAAIDASASEEHAASDRRRSHEQRLAQMTAAEVELRQAEQAKNLIETVPFGQRCAEAGCRFVSGAVVAQGRIPDLKRTLVDKPNVMAAVGELSSAVAHHRQTIEALTEELITLDKESATHRPLAAMVDKLAAAEARIAELTAMKATTSQTTQARLEELVTELEDGKRDLINRRASARTALEHRAVTLKDRIKTAKTDLKAAERDVATTEAAHQEALQLQGALAAVRADWDAAGGKLAGLAVAETTLNQKRADYEAARGRLTRVTETLVTLDDARLVWAQLHKALGRDGVPVLEMDAAGPRISSLANALLASCFGTRFSVELVTQTTRVSGAGMKESFALLVTDNERGGAPREIVVLSGGEQVIVSEALMNAISIHCNQRSAMPIRTCFRDETTGALDPENSVRYVQMLRQVLTLGGYHHVFFITQNPSLAALADAQIHVADGTATIRFPPYEEAA